MNTRELIHYGDADDDVLEWVEQEQILFDLGDPDRVAELIVGIIASRDTLGAAVSLREYLMRMARMRYIEYKERNHEL